MKFSDVKLHLIRSLVISLVLFFYYCTLLLYLKNQNIGYILITFAILLILVTFIRASLLHPLNKIWMRIGILLGNLISPIILGIIFFGMFAPYSIIMKIIGFIELRLKQRKNKCYWINRSQNLIQTDFKTILANHQ